MNATTQRPASERDFIRNVQQVEREDALINHRITWLLVFQGLLFTTMGLLLGKESDCAPPAPWLPMLRIVLPYVISLLGVVVAASVTWTVYIALYYQRELMEA